MRKNNIPPLLLLMLIAVLSPVTQSFADQSARLTIDTTCIRDVDCEIKDVGNCCGYYPQCVNKFADAVAYKNILAEQCIADGTTSACGYPELKGCRCVDRHCVDIEKSAP